MEQELFSWNEYDIVDTAAFNFYECVLKEDIRRYKKGTSIDCIFIDYGKGIMEFHDGGDILDSFELSLTVR